MDKVFKNAAPNGLCPAKTSPSKAVLPNDVEFRMIVPSVSSKVSNPLVKSSPFSENILFRHASNMMNFVIHPDFFKCVDN